MYFFVPSGSALHIINMTLLTVSSTLQFIRQPSFKMSRESEYQDVPSWVYISTLKMPNTEYKEYGKAAWGQRIH